MRSSDPSDDGMRPPTRETALRLLRGVYRKADAAYGPFSCPASGECCQLATTGREPQLWTPEVWAIEDRLRKDGRSFPPPRADGGCRFLDASGKRCSVYADRPFGCRTFFCERKRGPSREPAETVATLLRELEDLAVRVDPDERAPRAISACWR